MRFFRPFLSPFVFSIADKPIQKIYVTDDLLELKVCSAGCKADKDKIFSALKKSKEDLPVETELSKNKSVFQMRGLRDVFVELSKTANQIKAEDPVFFAQLAIYEESLESDLADSALNLSDFINSELHMRYFNLQSLRREGVQHTIEFPLKSLAMHGLLSQKDLNQIVRKLWLRISAIRKEQSVELVGLPTKTDMVPYVFRMR